MNKPFLQLGAQCWVLILCLVYLPRRGAAQFVELTAEIEINDWSYWFFEDQRVLADPHESAGKHFHQACNGALRDWD